MHASDTVSDEGLQVVLDRRRQLWPGDGEPQVARDTVGERREPVAEVLDKGMTTRQDVGRDRTLEASHRPQSLLEVPVIPFQPVVEILRRPMFDIR